MFFTVTDAFNPALLVDNIGALQLRGLRPETCKEQRSFGPKRSAAEVWLMGPAARNLEKNNLAACQFFISNPWPAPKEPGRDLEKNIVLVSSGRRRIRESADAETGSDQRDSPLHWVEKWPVRKIASHLHIGRRTIAKYLDSPALAATRRERASKLDPFQAVLMEWLQQDPEARAPVIAQRYSRWAPPLARRWGILDRNWGKFSTGVDRVADCKWSRFHFLKRPSTLIRRISLR